MAMEINGSFLDYAVSNRNRGSRAVQDMVGNGVSGGSSAGASRKQGTGNARETGNTQAAGNMRGSGNTQAAGNVRGSGNTQAAGNVRGTGNVHGAGNVRGTENVHGAGNVRGTGSGRSGGTAEYVSELAKLVPSAEFRVGSTFSSAKNGITLTVNPQLLQKMQNDPAKEKEMKELIRGVESAINMLESINKASGWTVVYKHCYIDENGEFRSTALLRNDFMLNMSEELREERRENAEKLIEKTKEKAARKKKELEEAIAEKTIYLDDADLRKIIEAAQEEGIGKTTVKGQSQIGSNLDLKI